jgi:beta-glucanase (GH16 family)
MILAWLLFFILNVPMQTLFGPSQPSLQLTYSSIFTTASLTNIYQTSYWWGNRGGNGESETYDAQHVGTQNGALALTATHDNGAYHSGMITTEGNFTFQYGTVQAQVWLPAGQGLWPALWMLPANHQDGQNEVDIFEMLGNDPHTLYLTSHVGGVARQGVFRGPDFAAGWNLVGIDWQPDHLTWLVNGKAVFTLTGDAVPHTPEYLIANLAVGGNWPGYPDAATHFPAQYLINWIRVYQTV